MLTVRFHIYSSCYFVLFTDKYGSLSKDVGNKWVSMHQLDSIDFVNYFKINGSNDA